LNDPVSRLPCSSSQIERQGEQLKKQIAAAAERRDAAAEKLGKLQAAREETEASFAQARADGKRLRADVDNVEKAMFKANQEIQVRGN
jgi:chromosome segregation ATPase